MASLETGADVEESAVAVVASQLRVGGQEGVAHLRDGRAVLGLLVQELELVRDSGLEKFFFK